MHALREARIDCGLTQGELERISDVDASTISVIETGYRGPQSKIRLDTAERLAGALGRKVNDLFTENELADAANGHGVNCTPSKTRDFGVCMSCFVTLPATGKCDNCS